MIRASLAGVHPGAPHDEASARRDGRGRRPDAGDGPRAEENLARARTATFATLAFSQLLFSFGCRSRRFTLPQLGAFTNPWLLGGIALSALAQLAALTVPALQPLFKVAPLGSGGEWLLIVGLSLVPVTLVEVGKLARAGLAGRSVV